MTSPAPGSGTSRPGARAAPAVVDGLRASLDAYLDLLEKWNRVYNLTALRTRADMETLHVQDALSVLPWLPSARGVRVLDVGSGPGVPGIPLALARPDADFVLLDANSKKTAFLAQAVIELGLRNVRVETARIEDFHPAQPFDVVIARAFSDLRTLALAAKPVLARNARILAMKGAVPHDEIAALPPGVRVVDTPALDVPGLGARRHLVILAREQEMSA